MTRAPPSCALVHRLKLGPRQDFGVTDKGFALVAAALMAGLFTITIGPIAAAMLGDAVFRFSAFVLMDGSPRPTTKA